MFSPNPDDTSPKADERSVKPLSFLVQAEAQRMLSDAQLEGDPQRIADGWERRFIADRQRAEEMIALYEELGFEVAADPIRPEDMDDDCEDCQLLAQLQFQMIYTRKKPTG
jgi:hypothetical protein